MTEWDETYERLYRNSVLINTGISTVDSFSDSEAMGAEWWYVANKGGGANMRTGHFGTDWDLVADSSPAEITDECSPDIGTTLGEIEFFVDKSGNSVRLRAECQSDGWSVYFVRMFKGST